METQNQAYASLTPVAGGFALESSFDREMVNRLKAEIPVKGRSWDPGTRRWLIDPAYVTTCVKIVSETLGVTMDVPRAAGPLARAETRTFELDYVGACRPREGGEATAFGMVIDQWRLVFPETVLREFFSATQKRGERPTLYAVLGLPQNVEDAAIRPAFRRLAMQWHPDRCKEPGAEERMKEFQAAYDVLSDPIKRKKYNAGLFFEAEAKKQQIAPVFPTYPVMPKRPITQAHAQMDDGFYRSPLRCGRLRVEGVESLGRFRVTKILDWHDIVDAQGRTKSVTWPSGAQAPVVDWIK